MSTERGTLRPIGTWDVLWRGSFKANHREAEYVVDVDYFDFKEKIYLYRDGQLMESRPSPASFELDVDTTVEAALSLYGMKHVDLVHLQQGLCAPFQPVAGTGEAIRATFAYKHPALNRWIGVASWGVLVFALLTQIPVIFNSTIAHLTGSQMPTLDLPTWANTILGVAGILAALDRALQLKFNKWIDN